MKTIEEIKANCDVVDGDDMKEHWVWLGAQRTGRPQIHAPNFTSDATGQTMTAQTGARAVWHISTGAPIAYGHRAYMKCAYALCVNPACVGCGTVKQHGRVIRSSGRHKGLASKIAASRRNSAKQRKVTPAITMDILSSVETNQVTADRLGLHKDTVALVRRGKKRQHDNPFQGLMR